MNPAEYFPNRRTIRRYSDREVSPTLIDRLLLAASHAPTLGNIQLYSAVITRDEEGKRLLSPAHFCQPQVTGAQVVITFCADLRRYTLWCREREADAGMDNLQSFIAATIDTIAFAQQFNTLAEMEGLGVCWLGTTTYNAREIAQTLHLPSLVIPLITLTVGYPAEEGVDVGRLPLEAIIHHETYTDYTPERIDSLYAEKEQRADSKAFVKENNVANLAQVFTTARYPRANNEAFSEKFAAFLRSALKG